MIAMLRRLEIHRSQSALKKGLAFLLLVYIACGLFSCSFQKTKKTFKVGFSQCTLVNKWRQTMLHEMKRELSFHPEIDFIVEDADGHTEKQIEQIQELIDQKVDLLIVSPNEAAPITDVVEKAFNKGIRVIIVDRRTLSQHYAAYVGASNYEVGVNAATFAVSLLKGKGTTIHLKLPLKKGKG